MTYGNACDILESDFNERDNESLIRAEIGMGAVSMGFDPYDAMIVHSMSKSDEQLKAEAAWKDEVAEAESLVNMIESLI